MGQTYKILSGPSDVAPPQAGEGSGPIPASGSGPCWFWTRITAENMPPKGQPVWLYDGEDMWMGGWDDVDSESWLWCDAYFIAWHNIDGWDADLEACERTPTHWMPMPSAPNTEAVARSQTTLNQGL